MKWNVSVLRRSGECERTEVADFELSEFFNRIASAEGKAWVLSVERVGDVGDVHRPQIGLPQGCTINLLIIYVL